MPSLPSLEPLEGRFTPATFVVGNAASGLVNGSLGKAIADANAAQGPDTIRFDPAVFGLGRTTAIVLTEALPAIQDDTVIEGLADLRLSIERAAAAPDFRLFEIGGESSVQMYDLRIANGRADMGGGILNYTSLALTRCTVEGNATTAFAGYGGGIYSRGSLTLTDTIVRGNATTAPSSGGGGVAVIDGGLVAERTTIANNTASFGGGVFVQGGFRTFQLTNTTISNNVASQGVSGSGLYLLATLEDLTVNLYSCTIADNQAPAGAIGGIFTHGLDNTTVTVRYQNTLFANNSGANVHNYGFGNYTANLVSLGNNLSTDGSGNLTQATDLPNTALQLRPLGDYGGLVPTRALLPGSAAIDAGFTFFSEGDPTTDARGFARSLPADIGAFEAAYTFTIVGGDNQTATAGGTFTDPLRVQLTESGFPVVGLPVSFTASGVTFNGSPTATAQTDAAGVATSPVIVALTLPGVTEVRADAGGANQVMFTLFVQSGPLAGYLLRSVPTSVSPGQGFFLDVKPVDAFGNAFPLDPGGLRFTSSDPSATLPPEFTFEGEGGADQEGYFRITGFALNSFGNATITLTPTETATPPAPVVLSIHVLNTAAPTLSVGGDGSAIVGEAFRRSGVVLNFEDKQITLSVEYGDGGSGPVTMAADGTFQLEHVYAGAGTFTVRVRVADEQGREDVKTFRVTVTPAVQPSLQLGQEPGTATVGTPFTRAGSVLNGDGWPFTLTADYGDGSSGPVQVAADGGFTLDHTYTRYGTYTVRVTLTNGAQIEQRSFSVQVSPEFPPSLQLSEAGGTATANSPFTRAGSVLNGDGWPFTLAADYGDGSSGPVQVAADGSFALDHTYTRYGTYSIRVTLTNGAQVEQRGFTVTVFPEFRPELILSEAAGAGTANTPFTRTGSVLNGDGWPFTLTADYGDGTTEPVTVDEAGGFTLDHTYTRYGTYTVRVTLTNGAQIEQRSFSVQVSPEFPPSLQLSEAGGTATANSPFTRAGSVLNGDGWPFTLAADYGDGSSGPVQVAADGSFALDHTYTRYGTYSIRVTLTNGAQVEQRGFTVQVSPEFRPVLEISEIEGFATANRPFRRSGQVINGEGWPFTITAYYGDGTTEPVTVDEAGGFTLDHTYTRYGTYSVRVTLTNGAQVEQRGFIVTVFPAFRPDLILSEATGAGTANSPFTREGSVLNGEGWPFTLAADYGDGSSGPVQVAADGSFALDHTYTRFGTYSVRVTLTNGAQIEQRSFDVVVIPEFRPSLQLSVAEQPATAGTAFERPGTVLNGEGWPFTLTADYGDGVAEPLAAAADGGFVLRHTYAQHGSYLVRVTLTNGEQVERSNFVAVVQPEFLPDLQLSEAEGTAKVGTPFRRSGQVIHGDGWPFRVSVDYGDTTPPSQLEVTTGTFQLEHDYLVPGTYLVRVTLTNGEQTEQRSFAVIVTPRFEPDLVLNNNAVFANVGQSFRRGGQVLNSEGWDYTATVKYGDGTSSPITVDEAGNFVLTHTYADEGSFLVHVTLTNGGQVEESEFYVDVLLAGVPTQPAVREEVPPGETAIVHGPGVTVDYANNGTEYVTIIVAAVPVPVAGALDKEHFQRFGLGILASYDLRVINASPSDVAKFTFDYTPVPNQVGDPWLTFFNHDLGQQQLVRSPYYALGTNPPSITFVLDSSSVPQLTHLGRTVFTIAVPVLVPVPPAPTARPSDVGALASILAGQRIQLTSYSQALTASDVATGAAGVQLIGGRPGGGVASVAVSGGGAAAEAVAAFEAGPLRELPTVPAVLTDLPSVTLTPAGTEPLTAPTPTTTPRAAEAEETPPAPMPDMPAPPRSEDNLEEGVTSLYDFDPLLLSALVPLAVRGSRRGKRHGNDLFIVPGEDGPVGEGGV